MEFGRRFLSAVVFVVMVELLVSATTDSVAADEYKSPLLHRSSFPTGFSFGTASSSYQYEGGASEGYRKPSIWDTYTHKYPGRIADGSNGDVAVDSYHRYKEDVANMKELGVDAYRFSISWSRVLPNGKRSGGINKKGIQYYNNLINELLANGITPFATLFHWDLPQALEDEYAGFLNHRIVNDFVDYADVCFNAFGDRVKHWITLNEPFSYSSAGYAVGIMAPGRCSAWQPFNCSAGDSATEPYSVTHNQLLAHAAAVKHYKQKYQVHQQGKIGITLNCNWMVPVYDAKHHQNAALRALDFMFGWFMDPITYGEYPRSMQALVGNRLPKFTREQSIMLRGSFDFLGLNYYTANYASYAPNIGNGNPNSYLTDARVNQTSEHNGTAIGPKAGSDWLYVYPRGIRDLLLYIKRKYKNPLIYITENGVDEVNNPKLTIKEALIDKMRIDYHYRHLMFLAEAIKEGVNVRGYFAWSLLDNFEWYAGYTVRFGIYYVDFKNGLKRYPKLSARWFKNVLKK